MVIGTRGGGGSVETVTGTIVGNSLRPFKVVYFDGADSYVAESESTESIKCAKNSVIVVNGGGGNLNAYGDVELLVSYTYRVYGDFEVKTGSSN